MRIAEDIIEAVRSQANIVDVIGDYITLEKRGRNHFACCPFHQEDSASFSVSEEKQLFHCFGCHEGGNVFSFPMKYEGLSFQEAVLHVAKYTNIDVSALKQQSKEHVSPKQEYYDLMQYVSEFYAYLLQTDKGKAAKAYLTQRGITETEIKHFQIGFAPDEQLLGALLEEKGYSLEKARELGLLFEAKDMTTSYDAFRGRVVFPITDSQGRIVAFSGRIITQQDTAKEQPKYFHSPESLIFKKREILYNYAFAKQAMKKDKEVYVCEGIFDVIALAQAGIHNAIGTLGTALTHEQVQLLKKTQTTVTFVYDNDTAGKNALLKALFLCLQQKVMAQAVIFWEYSEKDLAEFLQRFDALRLRELMQKKVTVNDYYLAYYQERLNLKNNEDKQQFVKEMVAILQYSNRPTREHYYGVLQELTGYSQVVLQEFVAQSKQVDVLSSPISGVAAHAQPVRVVGKQKMRGQEYREKLIIKGLSQGSMYVKIYQAMPVYSQNEVFRNLIYALLEDFRVHHEIDVARLIGDLSAEASDFLTQALYLAENVDEVVFREALVMLEREAKDTMFKRTIFQNNAHDKQTKMERIQAYLDFKANTLKGK